MRILVITDSFFAREGNGTTWPVAQISELLAARGDAVCILTSDEPYSHPNGYRFPVRRDLVLYGETRDGRHRATVHNRRLTGLVISQWAPDAILILGLHRISLGPALAAEETTLPVFYGINDEHLADYLPGRFSLAPKKFTGFLLDRTLYRGDTVSSLQLRHPICTSVLLKMRLLGYGAPVGHAAVIYQGVPCDSLKPKADSESLQRPPRILCSGGLTPSSGAQSVVRALAMLRRSNLSPVVTLTGGGDLSYTAGLKHLVATLNLEDRVVFAGHLCHGELADLYSRHDIFVFPSMHAEPNGQLHLEAMASGLAVASTLDGGQREFLRPNENCLCFPAGDAASLARSLCRLLTDAPLRRRLTCAARTLVETSHSLDRYVAELRGLLGRVTSEYAVCA